MVVSAIDGHELWASQYDRELNPLLALETRILRPRLHHLQGLRVVDIGVGTGRWMTWVQSRGARVSGLDICHPMLRCAAAKPDLAGRLVLGDGACLPFRRDCADLALCSFALGYLRSTDRLLREMARVARRVIITDVHPEALQQGWTRSFRTAGVRYEIESHVHPPARIEESAARAGLILDWRADARFDEPEREIFRHARKEAAFAAAKEIPAVLIREWTRP